MLGSAKPSASLSSGLLARKGHARPAMRPQGFHGSSMNLDDLGWNDMGDSHHVAADVHAAPAPLAEASLAPSLNEIPVVPQVLADREALAEEIGAVIEDVAEAPPPVVHAVSSRVVARIGREVNAGKVKAAFTLRLDAERHLRLRLASATRNRSSQALVTEALDAFLASLPEIEGLASQLDPQPRSARAGRKS